MSDRDGTAVPGTCGCGAESAASVLPLQVLLVANGAHAVGAWVPVETAAHGAQHGALRAVRFLRHRSPRRPAAAAFMSRRLRVDKPAPITVEAQTGTAFKRDAPSVSESSYVALLEREWHRWRHFN